MKKILSALLLSLTFTGCYSASLKNRLIALESEVEQNHKDMHTEDKKIADAIEIISRAINLNDRRFSNIERNVKVAESDISDLQKFKAAHDKRWPKLMETDEEKYKLKKGLVPQHRLYPSRATK